MNARSYPRRASLDVLGAFTGLALALLFAPASAHAQVCGNSALEAPEGCDDGDLMSMDGCSSTCAIEPGWACACAAPAFSYSGETLAGRLGGDGGGVGPQMGCAGNDVLIGLALNWSDGNGTAVRTRIICGSFSVDGTGAVTTTQTTTEENGGSGCAGWDPATWSPEVTCPSGFGMVGMTGEHDGGTLFKDASIVCQAMGVDGRTAGPTMTLNIPGGGGGSTPQIVDCPDGTIARFFQTRAGCGQDALDLFCATPAVSCDGELSICDTLCGDGVVGAPDETCDDGNTDAGDGCDASCAIEAGWDCASAGMPCAAICGDGMTLGAEDCDTSGVSATCNADCTSPVCGDDILNTLAGEVCDDGNTDTGDGCDGSCDPESGWACACGAPTFSYSGEALAGRLGGEGGGEGPQMGCTGNDVLIGLGVDWSNGRGEAVRTRAICGSFSVDAGGAVTTTATTTQVSGGSGCGGWDPSTPSPDVTCPSGFGVVGLTGLASDLGGTTTLFQDVSIVCQALGVDGRTAGATMTLNLSGGGGTGTPQTVDCPAGTIARFFRTRSGCGQDALDLFCATPVVSCDGDSSICDTLCGDGFVGAPVEECDDGNVDAGDGCDATCGVEAGFTCATAGAACTAICGDGMTLGAEECDTSGVSATCDVDCTFPVCGDTTVNMSFGEDCDDGMETASCDGDCTVVSCGDGRLNLLASEVCDRGPDNSDTNVDACRTTCEEPSCGDSVVDSSETCDLGASNSDDAGSDCGTSCGPLTCGDGVIEGVEQCDEGGANSDSEADACRTSCALARCGDGVIDSVETCDDGFANSDLAGSPCNTSCGVATCGDGVMDSGEDCDDGSSNSDTEVDACRLSCAVAQCGDGVIDTGESCDEGRSNSDLEPDQCRRTCQPASCGDGVVDAGEGCDEGDANSDDPGATCRLNCALASCGDGVLDTGEECDDGDANADTADACRTTCVNPSCGDDIVDAAEACDDGGDNSDTQADACRSDCSGAACGDGVVDTGETCDDGDDNSDTSADSCRTSCDAASCGDGVVDTGEDCDDGGASDSCSASCETVEMDAGMPDGSVDAGVDGGDAGFGISGGACSVQPGSSSRGALLFLFAAGLVLWRRRS